MSIRMLVTSLLVVTILLGISNGKDKPVLTGHIFNLDIIYSIILTLLGKPSKLISRHDHFPEVGHFSQVMPTD